jgi:mRNA-degrading endonuclease RelE of RelBE toxin-antitoxin system
LIGNDFEVDDTSPEYRKSLKNFPLPSHVKEDLQYKIEVLKKDPKSVAEELKGKYKGKYKIYIGKERRTHRLQCIINWNTRKIKLLNIKPRNFAYSED